MSAPIQAAATRAHAGLLVTSALWCVFLWPVHAQEQGPPELADPKTELIAPEVVHKKIEEVEKKIADVSAESSTLTKEEREKVLPLYRQALDKLKLADADIVAADDWQKKTDEAPGLLRTKKEELARPPDEVKVEPPPGADLATLEELANKVTADLAAARQEAANRDADPAKRAQRRSEITTERVDTQKQLDELLHAGPDVPPTEGESVESQAARKALLDATKRALALHLVSLDKEVNSYEARRELVTVRAQAAKRDVDRLMAISKAWLPVLAEARNQAILAARQAIWKWSKPLRNLAEANFALVEERAGAGEAKSKLTKQADARKLELQGLKDTMVELRGGVADTHRTEGIARRLVKERGKLPDDRTLLHEIAEDKAEILKKQRRLLEIENELLGLSDVETVAAELIAKGNTPISAEETESLQSEALTILRERVALLNGLTTEHENAIDQLSGLMSTNKDIGEVAVVLSDFISERLVWIRSDLPLQLTDLRLATEALKEFLRPRQWVKLAGTVKLGAAEHGLRTFGIILLVVGVLALRWPLRRRLNTLHARASNWRTDSIGLTLEGMVLVIVIASGLPTVMWATAWAIGEFGGNSQFGETVAIGLTKAGNFYLGLEILRWLIRPGGIAEVHLRWPSKAIGHIYGHCTWLLWASLLPGFLFAAMQAQGTQGFELRSMTLVRTTFVLLMFLVAVFIGVILRPRGPFSREMIENHGPPILFKLRWFWYAVVVCAPLALAALVWAGYTYTAIELLDGLWNTLQLAAFLFFFRSLTLRWLMLARRRLALEQARRRQEAAEAALQEKDDATRRYQAATGTPELKLATIDQQTRTLIGTAVFFAMVVGMWWLWKDLLPALRMLDQIELWSVPNKGIENGVEVVISQTPISLANLLGCILAITMTIFAARDIPGLLEITILRRIEVSAGSRYATLALARYIITGTGIALAFVSIGIGWDKIQWLVAALSLGLGFGLQEIFANFVSGIVLLFERPIRVGDIVTVGTLSGKVSKIQMRATTITDWNLKELVIPNKTFITGQLVNWTLTAPTIRVVIPVGVAYGTDVALAQKLLLQAASECPDVIADPPTTAFVRQFGASSIEFELGAHLPAPDHIPNARHELHERIQRKFRDAGIEIAFPQMDLHLRSVDPQAGATFNPIANPAMERFDA